MTSPAATVNLRRDGPLYFVEINRPHCRNAVDRATALALGDAFRVFEADDGLRVAILSGAEGQFCAGADLKAVASGDLERMNRLEADGDGPMGPTRMQLSKPVIAAVSGHCVAGGLELALWCDLRIADETALFGVYCRRVGVPLVDGGTVRLPRAIGMSRALDLILTGRTVDAKEALYMGLANRLVPKDALAAAVALARDLAALPQSCLRNDRLSTYEQWALNLSPALDNEFRRGCESLYSGEAIAGARRFSDGQRD